ncbi:MAG: Na+/H+ antiporter NhaC family protein [Muribaculaceae bacterium]|nr:Na+/H+ antiporter NhaC family protein [Muribaculaceae bacterium]
MNFIGTYWSLLPPLVAMVLSLITKEVYSSLFVGIVLGAIFYCISAGTGFEGFITHLFDNTVGTGDDAQAYGLFNCLADKWNVGILVFMVILGTMVALTNKAGGSAAFGRWASKRVKSAVGAQIATLVLGLLIFIDDYFNCLTVGSVMRPITKRHNVSREKLAYLIDSTAAPVCVIAPISSWAAAIAGFCATGENGLALFCQAIPFNFYAFFSIFFILVIVLSKHDFAAMHKFNVTPATDEAETDHVGEVADAKMEATSSGISLKKLGKNGTVLDLVMPILLLIGCCVLGMIYSGGFFSPGETHMHFIDAFAASNASTGLVIGALSALILTIAWLVTRRVINFEDAMSCLIKGFEAMVPAMLILVLAWTLKSMTDSLGAATYVAQLMQGTSLQTLLPAVIFVVALFLALATGTSWGTFGILIPICVAVFPVGAPLRIISISACMAGAVCGDHISPISDTTIMASAGSGCKHVNHVSSQLPYAVTVASIAFVSYIVAGISQQWGMVTSGIVSWTFGLCAMAVTFFVLKKTGKLTRAASA